MTTSATAPASSRAPLFLVGTGRCGSTIAYSLLAMHPDVAWIPSWTGTLALPQLALVNRVWDLPGMDGFREARMVPKPAEPNALFEAGQPDYLDESVDAGMLERSRAALVPIVESVRRWHGKPRFLGKLVGRPVKVDVLAHAFPDAQFVHVTRGLRPTVCSLVRVDFFQETGSLEPWPWGPIPAGQIEQYERRGRPAELAAAIQIQHNLAELDRQLGRLAPARWMEMRYSDLVADPVGQVRRIFDFARLPVDARLQRRLEARNLYPGADRAWEKFFKPDQLRNLEEFEALVAAGR